MGGLLVDLGLARAYLGRVRCPADFLGLKKINFRPYRSCLFLLLFSSQWLWYLVLVSITCVHSSRGYHTLGWKTRHGLACFQSSLWCWIHVRLASWESMITSSPRDWSPLFQHARSRGLFNTTVWLVFSYFSWIIPHLPTERIDSLCLVYST